MSGPLDRQGQARVRGRERRARGLACVLHQLLIREPASPLRLGHTVTLILEAPYSLQDGGQLPWAFLQVLPSRGHQPRVEHNWENQAPISQTKKYPLVQQLQMPWVLGRSWAPGGKGEAEGRSPHYDSVAAVTKHHKMSALEQRKPTVSVLEIRHPTHLVLAGLVPSEAERKVWPRPPLGLPRVVLTPMPLHASPPCSELLLPVRTQSQRVRASLLPKATASRLLLYHLIFTNLNYYLISK